MKKITIKQREYDVKKGIEFRRGKAKKLPLCNRSRVNKYTDHAREWIDHHFHEALGLFINKNKAIITLPRVMNFSSEYDTTILYVTAIRILTDNNSGKPSGFLKLQRVNFNELEKISTSAALVLTAELSKWDDSIIQRLRPLVKDWKPHIVKQFYELGFFDLFKNNPLQGYELEKDEKSNLRLVKYIKGECGDSKKARLLREEVCTIVGDSIDKWTFLRSGLDEAITNVTQHAYPDKNNVSTVDKNWYLTGSYNKSKNILKVVFYDQGVGIPKTLPTSGVWERVQQILYKLPSFEQKNDEMLLKAAVELDRTSTGANDRGKGLHDLLEFIKKRGNGNLSIISRRGLYRFTLKDSDAKIKTVGFENPLLGTLIIWSVALTHPAE